MGWNLCIIAISRTLLDLRKRNRALGELRRYESRPAPLVLLHHFCIAPEQGLLSSRRSHT
jgi:hypothetical protein